MGLTGLGLILVLGMAGAVTALGDLLFLPADGSPLNTVRSDFSATASLIENLRVVHPMLAMLTAAYLVWLGLFLRRVRPCARGEALESGDLWGCWAADGGWFCHHRAQGPGLDAAHAPAAGLRAVAGGRDAGLLRHDGARVPPVPAPVGVARIRTTTGR